MFLLFSLNSKTYWRNDHSICTKCMISPVVQKCNAFGNNSTMELGAIKTVLAEELMPTCNAMHNNQ